MIVVSDTTPLHYLILIGRVEILPTLFEKVLIPDSVVEEMLHPKTPSKVRKWIANSPRWISVEKASIDTFSSAHLGRGEMSAIAIAIDRSADGILMDDRKAIRHARQMGLTVLTTLTVLEIASKQRLLPLDTAIDELSRTNFRMPKPDILEIYLQRNKNSI